MSITKKVTLVICLLASLLLIGAGYAMILLQDARNLDQARREGQLLGRVLEEAAEASIRDHGHLGALADLASRDQPALVIFYGADARAVAPVPIEEEPVVNARARRVIERKQVEEEVVRANGIAVAFVYRAPLQQGTKVVGALELRLSLEDRPHPMQTTVALVSIGALLLLFALVVGLFSQRAIGRPIAQLMDGMDEVIQGDLTAALPLDRNDEIGRIAYRFNEMTARLRAAQDEIRKTGDARLLLEQHLRQSEKLATIGQLSAEIAHEVGTPLNVIGGRARVLERKATQPEEVSKNARIIADQATRITKIIQQMLDLTRARAPQRGPVDIVRTINDAIAFLEYQIERQHIRVLLELPAGLPLIHGDADGLQQVVLNLLLNAIQAMPDGGRLNVCAGDEVRRRGGLDLAPPQQFVRLWIEDEGMGISSEQREQIFEPFYSTKGKGEGSGLGLTVVHGIIKEHDGWIEVSAAASGGTVFQVYLPVEPESDEEPESDDGDETKNENENHHMG